MPGVNGGSQPPRSTAAVANGGGRRDVVDPPGGDRVLQRVMANGPEKTYIPSAKHKQPKGFGSICPRALMTRDAQQMLDHAISVPEVREKALWAAEGLWLFMAYPAHPHTPEHNEWHGYPVIGAHTDPRVLKALMDAGAITKAQFNKLTRQKRLPTDWPA